MAENPKGKRASGEGARAKLAKAGNAGEAAAASAEEAPAANADRRLQMISAAAYYRAERRGFAPGGEVDDWLAAEREVDELLADESLLERLGRERDELRVRMHLAKLDLRRDWDALEHKWQLVRVKSGGALREARGAGTEIGAAAGDVLAEIREGYKRIRGAL
jgi:hypothetical protein